MRFKAVLFGAVALLACQGAASDGPTAPPASVGPVVEVGETFTLVPGTTAEIPDAGIHVTFRQVAADSRCPEDVDCVWEGDAAVVVETMFSGAERTSRLHTPGERMSPSISAGR